jgi:MFS family permease
MSLHPTAQLRAIWPLLLGMALLMLGAGLQGTLLGLRATLDGFAPWVTGIVMSCYYLGYIAGSVVTPQLVARVGHIRVFAALTAIASVAILLQAVWVAPISWSLLRAASGFCFAGIYVVAESWLNDRASNADRGTLLAIYMVVIYAGLGGGQFLLTAADPAGPLLFVLISMLISLAVVPMSLSAQAAPAFAVPRKIAYSELYAVSPLGVVGVIASGAITGSMFSMAPVYAQLSGLSPSEIATFMAVSILAAVFTQLPIGRVSDRVDRRAVLIVVCGAALLFALSAAWFGAGARWLLYLLAAGFGGLALTLYSLSLSHINDHLSADQIVSASASIIVLNGAGSALGPLMASAAMQRVGAAGYFYCLAASVGALLVYAAWRKGRRAAVPSELKVPFVNAQPQAVSGEIVAEVAHRAAEARDMEHPPARATSE